MPSALARFCTIAFAFGMSTLPALAAPRTTTISDLGWLVGVWHAQNGKDDVENLYLPIRSGEIVATFTAVTDSKVSRYELLTYQETNGQILRRELAFGPAFNPLEPIPTRVVNVPDKTHITYGESVVERTGKNTMTVTVVLHPKDAPVRTVHLYYTRILNFAPAGVPE